MHGDALPRRSTSPEPLIGGKRRPPGGEPRGIVGSDAAPGDERQPDGAVHNSLEWLDDDRDTAMEARYTERGLAWPCLVHPAPHALVFIDS